MERHEVSNNKEYRGYYSLSNDIMEDLYGEEEEILEWDEMVNQYQPILTSKGLQLKERGIQYDTCWGSCSNLDSDRIVCSGDEGG